MKFSIWNGGQSWIHSEAELLKLQLCCYMIKRVVCKEIWLFSLISVPLKWRWFHSWDVYDLKGVNPLEILLICIWGRGNDNCLPLFRYELSQEILELSRNYRGEGILFMSWIKYSIWECHAADRFAIQTKQHESFFLGRLHEVNSSNIN